MLFFGHIATTIVLADATGADRTAAIAGNLVPDVVDKSGRLLRLFPAGRWLAHGLPALVVCSTAVACLSNPRKGLSFALGYSGHLLCDLYLGGRVPWLIPLRRYRWRKSRRPTLVRRLLYFLPEAVGLLVITRLPRETDAP